MASFLYALRTVAYEETIWHHNSPHMALSNSQMCNILMQTMGLVFYHEPSSAHKRVMYTLLPCICTHYTHKLTHISLQYTHYKWSNYQQTSYRISTPVNVQNCRKGREITPGH